MEIAAVLWIFLLFIAGLAAAVAVRSTGAPARTAAGSAAAPANTAARPVGASDSARGRSVAGSRSVVGSRSVAGSRPVGGSRPAPRSRYAAESRDGAESRDAAENRYAAEVAVVAERAAVAARRRRAVWAAAQEDVDAAWADFARADADARRFAAAAAYPVMRRRRAKGENADRARFLRAAAFDACRQREISIGQLNDILALRGWNERLHPAAQESALRAAVRDHRYDCYLRAVERERAAWVESERAAEALRGLRAEACLATVRAGEEDTLAADAGWWARRWAAAEPVRAAAA